MSEGFTTALPEPGALVGGKWRLGDPVGHGGMGVVYRARHDTLGRTVALKFLRPGELAEPSSMERFFREAKLAGLADHPGIARVIDFAQTDEGLPYLVMEYLEGPSLQDLLEPREEPIELVTGIDILISVLDTLQYIHDRGVIHRDLKPANIFCRRDGDRIETKVFDFGIARPAATGGSQLGQSDRSTIVGTPYFTSPEQAQGHDVGPRSDLWSIGVMLYLMATGQLPFVGDTGMEVYAKVIVKEPKTPSDVNPNLPPLVDETLAVALSKAPLRRYASASVMAEALRTLRAEIAHTRCLVATETRPSRPISYETIRAVPPQLEGKVTLPTAAAPVAPPSGPRRRFSRRLMWNGAAIVALVAAFVMVDWNGRYGEPSPQVKRMTDGRSEPAADAASMSLVAAEGVGNGPPLTVVWTPYRDRALLFREAQWVVEEFSRATNRPVNVVIPDSYDEAIGVLLRGDAHFASFAANSYVMAKRRNTRLELLVRHLIDGGPSYQSMCLALQTSGIKTLGELQGAAVCFVDPASTSGFLYPRLLFREAGVDVEVALGKRIFAGGHLAALSKMRQGVCVAACVASSELHQWVSLNNIRMGALSILATSEPIPGDAIVMRHDLPESVKEGLRRGAARLIARSKAGDVPSEAVVTGFVAASDADYDGIRKLHRQ